MPSGKARLDTLLVEKKLVPSRQRAQALIMTGTVFVEHQPITKPGTLVNTNANIHIKGKDLPYVSRGGLKLAAALTQFDISVKGKTCLDVGASTGGFTDCLLQHGASHIVAVDVGYGQLAWKLRQDPRVTVLEKTNIRYLVTDKVPYSIDITVIDVSFISLKIVVPAALKFFSKNPEIVALIKPQFEVGRGSVGKGGVVKDPSLHESVIETLSSFFRTKGLKVNGVIPSPITGPKGNKEFLCYLTGLTP